MKRRFLMVGLAVLALCLATSGLALAAPQPPVTAISKTATPSTSFPGGVIVYTVTWTLNSTATNVTLQDDFLHGVDLMAGSALLTIPGGIPLPIVPTLTGSSIDRKTYEFVISTGPLISPAGTYTLTFLGQVDPNAKVYKGKYVTNSVNLYIGGNWKGKASVNTNLVPAP